MCDDFCAKLCSVWPISEGEDGINTDIHEYIYKRFYIT